MLFVSYEFIAFLIIFTACYYTIFKRFQWQFTLAGSIFFYFYAGAYYLVYMAFITFGVYVAALRISKKKQKIWLYPGLIFSLGVLVLVKIPLKNIIMPILMTI